MLYQGRETTFILRPNEHSEVTEAGQNRDKNSVAKKL